MTITREQLIANAASRGQILSEEKIAHMIRVLNSRDDAPTLHAPHGSPFGTYLSNRKP